METLTPPDVPPSAAMPSVTDIAVPADGLTRDKALESWRHRMHPPKPAKSELESELRSWSGIIGRRPWAAARYGATTALLMRSPSVSSAQRDDWVSMFSACAEAIEPLSRYTSGWMTTFHAARPTALPITLANALREETRKVPKHVRDAMCAAPAAVIESDAAINEFVADPAARHERDRWEAVRSYGTGVHEFLDRLAPGEPEETVAMGRIVEHVTALLDEFEIELPTPATKRERAEADARARAFLAPIAAVFLEKHSQLESADARNEHLAAAYERVLITYRRRLLRGLPLEGTEHYLALRVRSVRIDEWRKKSREVPSEYAGHGASAPPTPADSPEPDSGVRVLLQTAARNIDEDPTLRDERGVPYWEAQVAIEMLLGTTGVDIADRSTLKRHVATLWGSVMPEHSRSRCGSHAAQDVWLIMRTAIVRTTSDHHRYPR